VVDANALEAIDLLDLVHEILCELLLAENVQDVVGVRGAVHQRFSGAHPIALVHADVLALGNQILLAEIHAQLTVDLGSDFALPRRSRASRFCLPRPSPKRAGACRDPSTRSPPWSTCPSARRPAPPW